VCGGSRPFSASALSECLQHSHWNVYVCAGTRVVPLSCLLSRRQLDPKCVCDWFLES
jgi:hypothetical protein